MNRDSSRKVMPRYGGVEFSRIVRLWDHGVRVILMSAQANLQIADGHADVVIAKPFELDMLLDKAFRLLNSVRRCHVSSS